MTLGAGARDAIASEKDGTARVFTYIQTGGEKGTTIYSMFCMRLYFLRESLEAHRGSNEPSIVIRFSD